MGSSSSNSQPALSSSSIPTTSIPSPVHTPSMRPSRQPSGTPPATPFLPSPMYPFPQPTARAFSGYPHFPSTPPSAGLYPPQMLPQQPILTNNLNPNLTQPLTIKLSDSNYLLWKKQLLTVAVVYGLQNFLDGSLPCPPQFLDATPTQPSPHYLLWQKYNSTVMSWIFSSLNEDKMGEIVSFSTAYEIWEALRRTYESSSTACIMGLRAQLQRVRKDGITVSQYLAKIKKIADKFAAVGEPLSYRDHTGYIFEGLGTDYNHIVTSIQNRVDNPSLEDIRSLLLSYEARIERQKSVEQLSLVQANLANLSVMASPPFSAPQVSKSAPSSVFSGSHSTGSRVTSILGQPRPSRAPSGHRWHRGNRSICQICGKAGHIALTFYQRTNMGFQSPSHRAPRPAVAAPTPQAHVSHTLPISPSTTPPTHPDESWFMYSGATHHMTPHLSSLHNPLPYYGGEQVAIGDGHSNKEGSSSGHP